MGNIYILSVVCGIKYMSDLGVGKECWGGGVRGCKSFSRAVTQDFMSF